MTTKTEALKLALEALEVATTPLAKDRQEVLRAITAIREALADHIGDANKMVEQSTCKQALQVEQPAQQQEPVACERCEELGYDKARYFRLYEQACIELQKIKKQEAVAEIKISHSDLEGEVIEILSCELDAGTYELYTSPPASKPWVGLTHDEVDSWELPDCPTVFEFAQFIEAKLKEKNT